MTVTFQQETVLKDKSSEPFFFGIYPFRFFRCVILFHRYNYFPLRMYFFKIAESFRSFT
jgi:hypothetical protein